MDIVLIGMPGAGKTTVGKIIAEKTGLDFVDLDLEIEKDEKRTIKEIFSKEGELYFRKKETECLLKNLGKNRVVATGGGIVTVNENLNILKSSSAYIVFIDRPIEEIVRDMKTEGRPLLSQNAERIYTLRDERYEKYLSACNIRIINDSSAKLTADKIIMEVNKYENNVLKLAVIGDPIEHSMSPAVHSFILSQLDIKYSYEKTRVKKGELKEYIDYALKNKINGFNITMPHKIDILPYLDYIDKEAKYYGSVNTVRIKNGKLYGYNTDALGYVESLKSCGGSLKGKNVLILGAGGVVRTLAKTAVKNKAKSLSILNRTIETAKEITQSFPKSKTRLEFGNLSDMTIKNHCREADILINATPLGMSGYDGDFQNFDFLDFLKPEAIVSDLIYNPQKTNLLSEAEKRGYKTLNGMGMLIFQAILADEIYLDIKTKREEIYINTKKLLNETM